LRKIMGVTQHEVEVAAFMGAAHHPAAVSPNLRMGHMLAQQSLQGMQMLGRKLQAG
jgi:hypothetical protein